MIPKVSDFYIYLRSVYFGDLIIARLLSFGAMAKFAPNSCLVLKNIKMMEVARLLLDPVILLGVLSIDRNDPCNTVPHLAHLMVFRPDPDRSRYKGAGLFDLDLTSLEQESYR